MEFSISNFYIDTYISLNDKIFYKGDVQQYGELFVFFDGYALDEYYPPAIFKSLEKDHSLRGIYCFVFFDKSTGQVTIKNDSMGKTSLYYYFKNGKFIISNNVWNIVAALDQDPIKMVDLDAIKSLIFFVTIPSETDTIFKDIKRFPNGSIGKIDKNTCLSIKRYFKFIYNPDYNLSIDEEAKILDDLFIKLFRDIKDLNPGAILGFGNSGGFDSRLIAYYVNKLDIPSVAFVVGQARPNYWLDSTTKLLSDRIANYYGLNKKWIEYDTSELQDSMLLDIRNNPFHSTQLFKNSLLGSSLFDYEVTGQPGSMPKGLPRYLMSGTRDDLISHTIETYSYVQETLRGGRNSRRLLSKHFGFKFNILFEDSYLNDFFGKKDFDEQADKFRIGYDEFKTESQFEAWENFNERIIVKNDLLGGYESFSRTKQSYFLYYPDFFERMSYWPEDFFENRRILQVLFAKISPFLVNLPGQDFQPAKEKQAEIVSLFKKVEMAIRGRGLNFDYLLKSREYKDYVKTILDRYNPIFDNLIDAQKLINSNILNTVCGVNLIKLKLILDIVYYKEYSILEKQDYKIK